MKVEDPAFAKELSARLKNQNSTISATPLPIDARRTNCRKVYISWHKPTRNVWLNFGDDKIANRVSQKFNDGRYKCLGHPIKSSLLSTRRLSRGGRGGLFYNPVDCTALLSGVPGDVTSKEVEDAIASAQDKPRHVEMGTISHQASSAEVSVDVRSRLEMYGTLESFYFAPMTKGKRAKASAWFQDEADARSALLLNKTSLDILGNGKLTVTLVQSAKIKVPTTVYLVSKSRIDEESKAWREQHVVIHIYPDRVQRFTTLKIESDNMKAVAIARKVLEDILSGSVLTDGQQVAWGPALGSNGSTYVKLKSIEKQLRVVIVRDKSKRRLLYYGSPERFHQAVREISNMLKEESLKSYQIDLTPSQFAWTIRGGFKSIEQALGKSVAIFNVVSRSIAVNGTQQQCEAALAAIRGKRAIEIRAPLDAVSMAQADCPICFCEADNPIRTSCKHTYCLECLEDYCKSTASTGTNTFQVKCQGDEGTCSTVFPLRELKDHLSSSGFEVVLKSSFEEYIQRHPEAFHYCPTPECGYIYRCTAPSASKPPAYTCPNCSEPICTSCHARHGEYTCAEYKDIASGGYEALEKLKKELNIKDCPKCTTPMEKTDGCNHMTCVGCKAHICWVCMAVFDTSGPCYAHMNKEHGGHGMQHWII